VKLLYGVAGEGLGHAMRSRVVAEHLQARGHEVKLVASGRAYEYLHRYFTDVHAIPGFSMTYARGRVARGRSLARLARTARRSVRETAALYRRAISGFSPDACVSDFDSFTHMFGMLFDRPVLSLDHQHVVDRCRHSSEVKRRLPLDFAITTALVRAKLPRCRHYVVTSFYFPQPRRDHTTLVGPILRPEILALEPTVGAHVLVYQTGAIDAELLRVLRTVSEHEFVVYGRDAQAGRLGNVEIRAFDEPRFLDDLASARAVICNGGYTLLSEALHLGKPVLSLPVRHQGEQELNAAYLAALGLGRCTQRLDARVIRDVISTAATAPRIPCGNARAFDVVDGLLQQLA
jgi:uncharacterized protein (TIGR00661 family)